MSSGRMVKLSAFFPRRVFVFGAWHEFHSAAPRWVPAVATGDILQFAAKVDDAGGIIYLNDLKFKRVETAPGAFVLVRDGYIHPSTLLADASARLAAQRSESGEAGEKVGSGLYVPVTRKVSLTDETKHPFSASGVGGQG